MLSNERDINRLKDIIRYCDKIDKTLERLKYDHEDFLYDEDLQQSISFSLAQIGELCRHVSDEYKSETSNKIPWQSIVSFRNMIAHEYNRAIFDIDVVWQTATSDVNLLKKFCESELAETENAKGL